ncbi:MAG: hypothetical protein AB1649_23910 [Chloroflexota bacterium]
MAITSPQTGETLRGQVNITGNVNVLNFASAEIAFAYASDPTSTWFTIQTFSSPLPAGEGTGVRGALAVWDTTALTDGDYTLRLRVTLQDGSVQEALVTNLKIRNDLPIATATVTATPTPEDIQEPALPTPTTVPALVLQTYPTPTALPVNPATLTTPSIYSNLARGTGITLLLFALIGLILRLRAGK